MASLGGLPPWLDVTPGLYVQALHAGAEIGNQRRGQDIAAGEAKDRLGLAYAQLAAQEERFSEQAQAKMELAHATLAARQQQMDLMAYFRQQQAQQAAQREQDLNQFRASETALRAAGQTQKSQAEEALQRYREQLNQRAEENLKLRESRGRLSELDEFDLRSKQRAVQDASKALSAATAGGNEEAMAAAKSSLDTAQKEYTSYRADLGRKLGLKQDVSPATGQPYGEGALIRHKDSGKLYRVKNGVPVPEEDQASPPPDQTEAAQQ